MPIVVQPFELFQDTFRPSQSEEFVFAASEPYTIDILSLLGTQDVSIRKHVQQWETSESDIDGTVFLHSPTSVGATTGNWSGGEPVLSLLDKLEDEEGFARVLGRVDHTIDWSPLYFGGRQIASKQQYLQCVKIHNFGASETCNM